MNKISKLINLPVISMDDRAWLGRISDVLYDSKTLNVKGYIASAGTVIHIAYFIDSQSIKKIDKGCVWVSDKSVLKSAKEIKKLKKYKSYSDDAEGMEIIENGSKVGVISDMLYNMEIGEITHFEVSGGFTEDVLHGRKKINANKEIIFGNNNVEITDKGV